MSSLMSAAEILAENGVGATDIACILGLSPWGDPWTVKARKRGWVETEQTEEMFWGLQLQRTIAEVFSARMDLPIEWSDVRIWSPEHAWMYASPDAFVLSSELACPGREAVLEIKTAGLHQSGEWDRDASNEDGIPEYYVPQLEWQMMVTGLKVAYIAVLIAGSDFRSYRMEHDPVLAEILFEEGYDYWRRYLMGGEDPPIGGSERARKYIHRRSPRESRKMRRATLEETGWLNEYAQVKRSLGEIERRKKELENQLTQAIGDREGLEWGEGKFTWKRIRDHAETDWEKLARQQMEGYSEEERAAIIGQHTHLVEGYRRIHFRTAGEAQ